MSGAGQPLGLLPSTQFYLEPVGRGNSQPQKFVLTDGLGLCAVKFQQNPQGPRMLANEWIGYGLAEMLGIRHAPYGLVRVAAESLPDSGRLLVKDDDGDEVSLLPGIHFYSQWLDSATDLTAADLKLAGLISDLGMLAGVAVLDMLVGHWDRKLGNPNLLMVRQSARASLYVMDMGMAFGSAIWGMGNLLWPALPAVAAPLPYSRPPDQLFSGVRALQYFEPYFDAVEALTEAQIRAMVEALPEEWGVNIQERDALIDFIFIRAKALPANFKARFSRAGQEWWQ